MIDLEETTIDGPRTRRWVLEASTCPELAVHRIARLGIDSASAPYRRVRVKPGGSFFMATISGTGSILLDGRWQTARAGSVCLAPPRVLNAFHAIPGRRWEFCWMRYDEPAFVTPLVGAASPVRARAETGDLAQIIGGLRDEWERPARDAAMLHHWVELLHGSACRLARPWQVDSRMWKLWSEVKNDLAAPWTLAELARRFHVSTEHLRRLCLRELGRSPMQQLTYMRMQRAQELLERSDDKLDAIAPLVGYDSALVFSRAFKRWIGCSPSEYRIRV
jgi:AraC-like DNA-binding protein